MELIFDICIFTRFLNLNKKKINILTAHKIHKKYIYKINTINC